MRIKWFLIKQILIISMKTFVQLNNSHVRIKHTFDTQTKLKKKNTMDSVALRVSHMANGNHGFNLPE